MVDVRNALQIALFRSKTALRIGSIDVDSLAALPSLVVEAPFLSASHAHEVPETRRKC
jgi:hypothetical protein